MRTATFQTRGRVIDLLGREQIADAPAAISELLKNALDAGAVKARINYLPENKCIIVSDFGLGMRQSDLLEKWLVLATESKRGEPDLEWMAHATAEQRHQLVDQPPLGEKGIGRLAVAALGRAVLVWSRWGKGKDAERTLLFVHWDLFRHPKIGLDDAPVPWERFDQEIPSTGSIKRIFTSVRRSLEDSPKWKGDGKIGEIRDRIVADLESGFGGAIEKLGNLPDGNGTTFVILGATEEFEESLRKAEHRNGVLDTPESLKTILAFCDPFGAKKRIDVKYSENGEELKADYAFWDGDDLKAADHLIQLDVSAEGFVSGRLRRYHEKFDYSFQLPELPARVSSPGPMRIVLGYVPGREDSRLTEEVWDALNMRLQRYGGLYVYRDGIRVMPYGKTDFDYAKFEERRSLNAGTYFFSHRRMFGAVYLTKAENGALIEKAGREGFIHNGAYRGFTNWLERIFVDLAKTYYGTNPATPHEHPARKKRAAVDRLRAKAKAAKEEFKRNLSSWQRRLPVVRDSIKRRAKEIEGELANVEKAPPRERLEVLKAAMQNLDQLQTSFTSELASMGTEVPQLVSLERDELRNFDQYITERGNAEGDAIRRVAQLGARSAQLLASMVPEGNNDWAEEKLRKARKTFEANLREQTEKFARGADRIIKERPPEWAKAQMELLEGIVLGANLKEITDPAEKARRILETVSKQEMHYADTVVPFWRSVAMQLELLDEAEGTEALLGDIYRRTEQLETRTGIVSELAQLGQIVEGIDHEYKQLFYNADQLLKELAPYVRPEGDSRIKHLKICLSSLENKQNLLSPLYQRRSTSGHTFSGAEIESFIERLYSESRRQGTRIDFTPSFKKLVIREANQATVFAAAANLVSNSLYWVGKNDAERRILFQDYQEGFVVSDSGPGINFRDRTRVFEAFFTRRPSGRGLGLYIARTNLEAAGFRIELLEARPQGALTGACFYLYQVNNE
jgi:signal transduction histidine kinase